MLVDGEAGDRRLRPSREHIIPSALGGPDALCTFDVCEDCNSTLGTTTDGDLMREHLVSIVRQRFGIPGYSGRIPDLVMKAESMQTSATFNMKVPPTGNVTFTALPVVTPTANADGTEQFSVSGSCEQVPVIVKGKKAKIEAAGRKMLNPDGSELVSLEASIDAAAAEVTTEFNARFELDQTVIRRGLIKIAFGFAHLVLGGQWTFNKEAEPLRDAARGRAGDEEVASLVMGLETAIREVLLRTEVGQDTRHLIALMPTGGLSAVAVSLFGNALLYPLNRPERMRRL